MSLAPGDVIVYPLYPGNPGPPVYWLYLGPVKKWSSEHPYAKVLVLHTGLTASAVALSVMERWEKL
jgi:hypothetical protein